MRGKPGRITPDYALARPRLFERPILGAPGICVDNFWHLSADPVLRIIVGIFFITTTTDSEKTVAKNYPCQVDRVVTITAFGRGKNESGDPRITARWAC